jgi:AraC-like DNA-binding protein
MEAIAAQFNMHPKTLQRRLADEGITFAALVDEIRKEAAERYLHVIHAPNGLFEFLQGGFQMAQQSLQVRVTAAASDEPEVKAVCAGGHRDIESLVLNERKALAGQDYSEQWASPALYR